MTSVPLVVHPCGSGAQMPPTSCFMAGPGKAPLKPATSSHLRTSASPRSISQTTLTVGSEGEGGRGEGGQCAVWRRGAGFRKTSWVLLLQHLSWIEELCVVLGCPVGLPGPTTSKDTLPFCAGPQGGLGSMETTASSCVPAWLRAAGAARLVGCLGLGFVEAACHGGLPGLAAWSLDSSSQC